MPNIDNELLSMTFAINTAITSITNLSKESIQPIPIHIGGVKIYLQDHIIYNTYNNEETHGDDSDNDESLKKI